MRDQRAPDKPHTLHISTFVLKRLLEAADQRGLDPETLAEKLLVTLARDRLFDAVLDDRPVKRRMKIPKELTAGLTSDEGAAA